MIRDVEYSNIVSFSLALRSCDKDSLMPKLLDTSERMLKIHSEEESYEAWKAK